MNQVWAIILAICSGITCISGATTVVVMWVKQLKSPEQKQNDRISKLEEDLKELQNKIFGNDSRIELIEQGTRITQKAILALLSHGIDGNDVEAMKQAKKELQEFLIDK